MDNIMTPEERADRHRAWLESFGFSERDWDRIKAQAIRVAAGANEARMDDLDAPFYVGCYRRDMRHRPNGQILGTIAGCVVLCWPHL